MSSFNLFEMFGIPEEEQVKPKSTKSKGNEKNNKEKSKKTTNKDVKKQELKSPLKVYIGSDMEPVTLEQEGEIKEADVLAFAESVCPSYPADITSMKVLPGNKGVHVIVSGGMAKGTIKVSDGVKCYLGRVHVDILEPESELDLLKLTEVIKATVPVKAELLFKYSEKANLIFAYPHGKGLVEIEAGDSCEIYLDNGERRIVQLTDDEELGQLSFDIGEKPKKNVEKVPADIKKWLGITDSPISYSLFEMKEKGQYYMSFVETMTVAPKSKKALFPVDDVDLSLLFKTYHLTKEQFGGKAEVGKDAIIDFLVSNGHREFLFLDSNLVSIKYNEKSRIMLVVVRGSEKGVAEILMPEEVWDEWVDFSTLVFKRYGTEVLMELYRDKHTGEYLWYVPEQSVSTISVNADFEPLLQSELMSGLIKVGQFHSHGKLSAFFSSVDDRDEKFPGIYGVIGSLDKSEPSFAFRRIKDCTTQAVYVRRGQRMSDIRPTGFDSWLCRVHPVREESAADAQYEEVVFFNGCRGIVLSCKAEADFYKHVAGFRVILADGHWCAVPEDSYVGIAGEEHVVLTGERISAFDL